MTDSCCWIDLRDDQALVEELIANPQSKLDPARIDMPPRYLWINHLRTWAGSQGCSIEYPDMGWIVEQVSVDKRLLLVFLDEVREIAMTDAHRQRVDLLSALIHDHGTEGSRYRILADEY
jgi:hypothetical protein